MSSLFNIRQDHLSLLALIEQNEGVLSEDELQAFQLNQEDFEAKAISYAFIIKKYEAESNTIKAEIDRLGKLKKTADNAADRFKALLKDAMEQFKIDKIESETIKIGFRKSKKLELTDELIEQVKTQISAFTKLVMVEPGTAKIPEDMLDYVKVKIEVDGAGLKDAIDKEGVEIEGASVKENKNLQIR